MQEKEKNKGKEEEKSERIRKGLAALKMGAEGAEEQAQQEKRKVFMSDLRDALVSGVDDVDQVMGQKKKKKKKEAVIDFENDLL